MLNMLNMMNAFFLTRTANSVQLILGKTQKSQRRDHVNEYLFKLRWWLKLTNIFRISNRFWTEFCIIAAT